MARFTIKQKAFIDHYLTCLNATEAAKRAGYDGTYESLRVIGSTNLVKVNIKEEIESRLSAAGISDEEINQRFNEKPVRVKSKCVYLIEAENGLVKIGVATSVQGRLNTLNTASPIKLWLVAYVQLPNAKKLERKLHEGYFDKRVRGEWFRLSHTDVIEICSTYNFEVVPKND